MEESENICFSEELGKDMRKSAFKISQVNTDRTANDPREHVKVSGCDHGVGRRDTKR